MGNVQAVDRKMLVAKSATDATGIATFSQRKLPGFVGAGVDTVPVGTIDRPQQGFHHHISWATGVTAGTVVIECADDPAFAGTWAPMATIAWSVTSPSEDYAYTPGQPKAIRHRISVTVSGGVSPSVTTRLVGSPA